MPWSRCSYETPAGPEQRRGDPAGRGWALLSQLMAGGVRLQGPGLVGFALFTP